MAASQSMPKDDAAWLCGKELRLARRRARSTAFGASPRRRSRVRVSSWEVKEGRKRLKSKSPRWRVSRNPAQRLPPGREGTSFSRSFLLSCCSWLGWEAGRGKLRPAPGLAHEPHGGCLVCPHCARTDLPYIRPRYLERHSKAHVHGEI